MDELNTYKDIYKTLTAKKFAFIILGLIAIVILAVFASFQGAADIKRTEVLSVIIQKAFPFFNLEPSKMADTIVWQLRLPQILMAIIAGAGLAVSGAAMQGITRNPLVSPFTVGVSAGAALGAAVAIVLGASIASSGKYFIISNAFIFALGAAFLVLGISRLRGVSSETIILAGIAIMYIISAFVSLLQYIATKEELHALVHWMFGTLSTGGWDMLPIVGILTLLVTLGISKYSWDLNAMASGEDVAKGLGVNTTRTRNVVMVLATLATAGIICFTGIIGFICLMSPHITRTLIGADHRFLFPGSCIVGAFLLLASDTVGRTIIAPTVIPVGIVVAFLGGPFFLYLLITRRKQYWQ
ncbi:MAG: iron ABC transporter permease [bacterium]